MAFLFVSCINLRNVTVSFIAPHRSDVQSVTSLSSGGVTGRLSHTLPVRHDLLAESVSIALCTHDLNSVVFHLFSCVIFFFFLCPQMASWTSPPRRTTAQAATKPSLAPPLCMGSKGKTTGLVKLVSVSRAAQSCA